MRASLTAGLGLLKWAKPRRIKWSTAAKTSIAYADAFYAVEGNKYHTSDSGPQGNDWKNSTAGTATNGWGAVAFPHSGGQPVYAFGAVPARVFKQFQQKKQYIFILETLAQCLPV